MSDDLNLDTTGLSSAQVKRILVWHHMCMDIAFDEGQLEAISENTSDGYHTFKELYEYRLLYNALLFNEWARLPHDPYRVHKSHRHSDGELAFGGGWFIVMAELPSGQISNHYEDKDWDLFHIPVVTRADEYDGHTPHDVAKRLRAAISPNAMPKE